MSQLPGPCPVSLGVTALPLNESSPSLGGISNLVIFGLQDTVAYIGSWEMHNRDGNIETGLCLCILWTSTFPAEELPPWQSLWSAESRKVALWYWRVPYDMNDAAFSEKHFVNLHLLFFNWGLRDLRWDRILEPMERKIVTMEFWGHLEWGVLLLCQKWPKGVGQG